MDEHAGSHELEWHTSVWPLLLSIGILFLAPFAFSSYFVYQNTLLTVISLGIGVPLTLFSVGGWVREGIEDSHGYGQGHIIFAMPLFILAEATLFVGFFAAYWFLRFSAPTWPPAGTPEFHAILPIIMTVILVTSSITIHIAENKLEKDDKGGFITWLIITIVLGLIFLGIEIYEWTTLIDGGFTSSTNIFSSSFYAITGFHGSHVLVGAGIFICILIPALKGKINKHFVTVGSMYWHFVDVVWFFVVSQIYFL